MLKNNKKWIILSRLTSRQNVMATGGHLQQSLTVFDYNQLPRHIGSGKLKKKKKKKKKQKNSCFLTLLGHSKTVHFASWGFMRAGHLHKIMRIYYRPISDCP
jgi:hypothetical protein